jgi:hypothetical protein
MPAGVFVVHSGLPVCVERVDRAGVVATPFGPTPDWLNASSHLTLPVERSSAPFEFRSWREAVPSKEIGVEEKTPGVSAPLKEKRHFTFKPGALRESISDCVVARAWDRS